MSGPVLGANTVDYFTNTPYPYITLPVNMTMATSPTNNTINYTLIEIAKKEKSKKAEKNLIHLHNGI